MHLGWLGFWPKGKQWDFRTNDVYTARTLFTHKCVFRILENVKNYVGIYINSEIRAVYIL